MTDKPKIAKPSRNDSPKLKFGKGQPSNYCGKPGRSGPKKGNLNRLKNGNGLSRKRLVVGELPKQLLSVRREGRAYRRSLEAEVLKVKQEINVTDSHHIDTASAATIAAGIGRWLLRTKLSEMSTSDVLACSREITRAKQARDAAVKALGLDVPKLPPWVIDVPADSGNDLEDK